MVLNRYPWWKNLLVLLVVVVAFIYALPNLFVEDPAVQITGVNAAIKLDDTTQDKVKQLLQSTNLDFKKMEFENHNLLVRFPSTDVQLKAKDLIQETLGGDYVVALNLAPAIPHWLEAIVSSDEIRLRLARRCAFLLQVDVDSVLKQRIERVMSAV